MPDRRNPPPPTNRPPMACVDGVVVEAAAALVPLMDQAYLSGMGVFETLRAAGGAPLFVDAHRERLAGAGAMFGLLVPDAGRLRADAITLLAALGLKDARIRVTLSGLLGDDGTPFRFDGPSRTTMLAFPGQATPSTPARLIRIDERVDSAGVLAGHKCTSYGARALWMRRTREAGADEGLLLDRAGHLSGGVVSNLFWVSAGRVFTPDAIRCGCRPGVTRARVIAACAALDIPCEAVAAGIDALDAADEIFLTSAVRGIRKAEMIENQAGDTNGPVIQALQTALAREEQREVEMLRALAKIPEV